MINVYSVQFSRSVVSFSFWPHESQHAGPPCPTPAPRLHSNSCPSSQWCHPAISSFFIPFSSCPQSLPASESFLMSQLFTWGSQSIGGSALASFLPKNTQDWSPLEWTGWISLQSMGLSRVFSNTSGHIYCRWWIFPLVFVWQHHFYFINVLCCVTPLKNLSDTTQDILKVIWCPSMVGVVYKLSIVFQMGYMSRYLKKCPTLCDPMDYSLPCSSIHGIF